MRKISVFFAIILAILGTTAINVSAVEPTYKVSEWYESSYYYDNLLSLELTGDGASDVLMIALSQLGYHEGDSDRQMGGLNRNGSRNFVEYNVLVGKIDNDEGNGLSYGYAWCAAFCNWCLKQARIKHNVYSSGGNKNYVSCAAWVKALKSINVFRDAHRDYIPSAGDLIFFRSIGSQSLSSHVGFVLYVEDGYVVTIEGNHNENVGIHTYSLDDGYIIGFGALKYTRIDGKSVDYNSSTPTAGVFAVKNETYLRSAASNSSGKAVSSALNAGTLLRVLKFDGDFAFAEYGDTKGWAKTEDIIKLRNPDVQPETEAVTKPEDMTVEEATARSEVTTEPATSGTTGHESEAPCEETGSAEITYELTGQNTGCKSTAVSGIVSAVGVWLVLSELKRRKRSYGDYSRRS